MASWSGLYINTSNKDGVVQQLQSLTNDLQVTAGAFPADLGEYYMMSSDLPPTYIAVAAMQDNWVAVIHNSFSRLKDWGIELSDYFKCKVIVTMAQSVSDAYYFALYDRGQKTREIETCYSTDFEEVNYGEPFAFEGPEPGVKTDHGYIFDFEGIEVYCRHWGLTLQTDYSRYEWTILKARHLKKEISDYVQQLLKKKPWWKFW